MPKKRSFYPGGIFHLVNRGSKKEPIFFTEVDYSRFLDRLVECCSSTGDKLIHYCLLPNHFHLLVQAKSEHSIPKLMQKLLTSHSMYLCKKYSFVGSIFQGRYRAVHILDEIQLITVSRYIHRNPAEIYQDSLSLIRYPWSSFSAFNAQQPSAYVDQEALSLLAEHFKSPQEYCDFVLGDDLIFMRSIKENVYNFK